MLGFIILILALVLPFLFMTATSSPIGALFFVFSMLFNPFGLLAMVAGFALFIVGPFIYKATGYGKTFVWLPHKVMAFILGRSAIVVSEHNDIFLKSMEFDDLGVETIKFGKERKEFEDPDGALHSWLGMTFALADEVSGVLFDPRHAALGKRKRELDERGTGKVHPTEKEYEQTGATEWIAGVFEMPTSPEILDLTNVRHLVDGGERSEYPKRTEELYKHSRRVLSDGTPAVKFIYPIIGFLGTFGGIWLIMDQLGAASSTGGSSVTVSSLFLAFTLQKLPREKLKTIGLYAVTICLVVVPIAGMVLLFGPILTAGLVMLFALGYLMLPLISLITTPLGRVSGPFAKILLKLGLFGYTKPVFYWQPEGYELIEARNLPEGITVDTWYTLSGSLIGFSHEPTEESWGADVLEPKKIENAQVPQDKSTDSNIPSGMVPLNWTYRANIAPFGPTRTSPKNYYLHSGIALSRFEDSAMGEKSLKRLTQAKEKFGEDGFGLNDKTVLWATLFTMMLGIGLGTWVFIL